MQYIYIYIYNGEFGQEAPPESALERLQAGIKKLGEEDRGLVLDMVERLLRKD